MVGTVMSNLGLQQALEAAGVTFLRAAVGDRYVLELLKQHGGVLGGETSGPPAVSRPDHDRGRDRQRVAGAGGDEAAPAARSPNWPPACRSSRRCMVNVRVRERVDPKQSPAIQQAVARVEASLGDERSRRAARLGHRATDPRHGRGRGRGRRRPARERTRGGCATGGVNRSAH